ncbi:MAG: bifunctional phosphoribosylaminoimidazolecarboxamide formyltransferase/IMP cyclohydrolase [Bacteroidales bacterium]|nr:bifunctional phosphoribosylaminoimidazolecarboxamide formyltransferase/IMP cyclohydrolase [Bacteroidales bacterium]MDY0349045.1 bifunctional phosphoribosylaminoimidazolecarboxamide formyltransferase/IMP cyclohydrolase [Tenuifilaceae bacterium]
MKQIKSALISVYHKDGLNELVEELSKHGVKIFSTGGTLKFIEECGVKVEAVENLTSYPSILGGRVKTLHPKVFGGILARRENQDDLSQLNRYQIPEIDLVVVDLYPFEETVASNADESAIIEKIDIGGVTLIRAAAKNFRDVAIVSSRYQYQDFIRLYKANNGSTTLAERKHLAKQAFNMSSHYDTAIFEYFSEEITPEAFKQSVQHAKTLRYGENPHQQGVFYGGIDKLFDQLHGKEISYNNLLDIDAAINLISEFTEPTMAILKHNNACGLASRSTLVDAWNAALAGDPISAFGGVIICNREIDVDTATEMNKLFFEIVLAPGFNDEALQTLKSKKNRIILELKDFTLPKTQFRSLLNGVLQQDKDSKTEAKADMKTVTNQEPSQEEYGDMVFANIVVKHSKSNAIVLAKNKQLIASGVGQTSRVDALKHAIDKAKSFSFTLNGAVMASDAFFPFADSVEIAHKEGIAAVIQPGGSIRDQETIDYCNHHSMAMVFTGIRHFKH